jgi:uncharacterized protein (TIGR02453 family)
MMGGGAYVPPSDWLRAIRQEIDYNADEFKKIINNKNFKATFGELQGDKLKRPPKGYTPEHPEIELLKLKSFLATHTVNNKVVLDKDFAKYTAKVFKTLQPLGLFLNRAKD